MSGNKKRPAHRPSRRPLILRSALDELCETGADAGELASMVPIAERAGVTPAAMYYHFKSKNDLLTALLEFVEPDIRELGREVDPAGGATAWSAGLLRGFCQWVREDPAAARFYFITAASIASDDVNAAYDKSQHALAQRFATTLAGFGGGEELHSWIRGMGLVSLLHEVVSTSLQDRTTVNRGFATTEKAAIQLAKAIVA